MYHIYCARQKMELLWRFEERGQTLLGWTGRVGAQYSQGGSPCYDQDLQNDETFITKNNGGAMEVRSIHGEDVHSNRAAEKYETKGL